MMTEGTKKLLIIVVLALLTAALSLFGETKIENLTHTGYNFYVDLLQHSLYYFAITIIGCWLFPATNAWLVTLVMFGVSLVLEIAQYFTPARSFSIHDIVSNATGVLLAGLLVSLFRFSRRKRPARQLG